MAVEIYSSGSIVSSGAVIENAVIAKGKNGIMYVSSGGIANNTMVKDDGSMHIFDGGIADSSEISDWGWLSVSSGGIANSVVVSEWGDVYISGGGTVNRITVDSRGYISVSSGGAANITTVNSKGYMYVEADGTANSTAVNAGGVMILFGGAVHHGSLQIENGATVSAYQDSIIDFTLAERSESDGYLINDLSLISGAPVYTVTVSAEQKTGIYKLAQGVNSFPGTVSIGDNSISYGFISVNGEDFYHNGDIYSLDLVNGSLTLTVTKKEAPSLIVTINSDAVDVYDAGTSLREAVQYAETLGGGQEITFAADGTLSINSALTISNGITVRGNGAAETVLSVDGAGYLDIAHDGILKNIGLENAIVKVSGLLSNAVLNKQTAVNIADKGSAAAVVISSGGSMSVGDGGMITDTVVEKGGSLILNSGAVIGGSKNDFNGNITVDGKVNGSGANIHFVLENRTEADSFIISDINNISNAEYTVIISAGQQDGSYKLAGGANNFNQTITVGNGIIDYGVLYVNGAKLIYDDMRFSLRLNDGNLTVTVEHGDFVQPEAPIYTVSNVELTNQDVIITVEYSADSVWKQYKIDDGDWLEYDAAAGIIVSRNGTVYMRGIDAAENISKISEYKVVNIDKIAPTLEIKADNTAPTNQNVLLTAVVSDGVVEYFDGEKWVEGNSRIVEENGKYLFRVTDLAGNVNAEEIVIDNIDKIAPTLEIIGNATEWTNQDVILTAVVSDGLVEYFDGRSWVAAADNKLTVETNGTYQFRVTDLAGNVSVQEIIVDKIDKEPPTLEISGNAAEWTNQDVTLTAAASDGTVEYFDGSEWVLGNSLTVEKNGTYLFRATDALGNCVEKAVIVDKIDKEPPILEILGNAVEWTKENIILVPVVNDGIVEYFDGAEWVICSSLTVSENGTYLFRATDALGNFVEKSVTVDKIDKEAPTLEIIGNVTEWTNQDVILTAVVSDGSVEYFDGSSWVAAADNKLTVEVNGTYQFRVTDLAGNVTVREIVVDKIDKDAPTLEISGNAAEWTTENVTLTAAASDGTIEYFDGSEWVIGSTLTVEVNGTYLFRVTDIAGNITLKEIIVDKIDRDAPTLEIIGNATEWTNENVVLTAVVSDGTVEYFDGVEWVICSSVTVSENGTYLFRATDALGNFVEKSVTVDKIDKEAPTLEIIGNVTEWTNQDVILTAVVSDGLVEYFDGSSWIAVADNKLTVAENGIYQFRVKDLAGNITTGNVIVDKIDKEPPTLDIIGNAAAWTTENVTLTAIASEGTVEYFNGTEWVVGSNLTVEENGTYLFRATDSLGNFIEKSVIVDKIDKTAPVLEIIGNSSEWTNQNITLTVIANEGLIEYFNGSIWVAGDSLTVEVNGTYQFRATDLAGNVTFKEIIVDKIDKDAPTLEVSGNVTEWTNQDVVLTAVAGDGTIEYFDGSSWIVGDTLTVEVNGTYQFRVTDLAGNVTVKEIVVDKIDKTVPTLEIIGNVTEWTNQDIVLSAVAGNGRVEYFNGVEWIEGSSLTVTENGTYQFRFTDKFGVVVEKTVTVDKIDKTVPTLEIIGNVTEWTNQDVVLVAAANEGVVEYFDGSSWIVGNTLTVEVNGTYQFRATDLAGNVTVQEIIVDKIDKDAPTLEISGNTAEWTNQDVVLVAAANDGVIEYFDGSSWIVGDTLTVAENGTYQFRATDFLGNVVLREITVDKIDKTAPVLIGVTADITVLTNRDVKVTAEFSDDNIFSVQYKINNGAWIDYSGSVTMKNNGTIYFRAADAAGNITEAEYTVSNIDKIIPEAPVVTVEKRDYISNKPLAVTAEFANTSALKLYSYNGINWYDYKKEVLVYENGSVYFRSCDLSGNLSYITEAEVSGIESIADSILTEYVFIKSSFTAKNTNNKKQNGVKLVYGENAFNTVGEFEHYDKYKVVMLDSKVMISAETDLSDLEVISGIVTIPTVKEQDSLYSYSVKANSAGTLNITGKNTADVLFSDFLNVNLTDAAKVGTVDGGKVSKSQVIKTTVKKDIETVAQTDKYSNSAAGKFTVSSGAEAENIYDYANVIVDNASAGVLSNNVFNLSETAKTVDGVFSDCTRTDKYAPTGTATLKNNAAVNSIQGFKTVKITDSSVADDIIFGAAYTEKYTLKKGVETTSVTNTRNGSVTAVESEMSDINGYTTIKLTDSKAGNIYQTDIAKIVNGVETVKLTGSVTLLRAAVGDIENYTKVTMTDSRAENIKNVSNIVISKGFNTIASYSGTEKNDTLTIAANAVLTLGSVDFIGGTKNKFVNNGTLILSVDIDRSFISGKGDIAAARSVWDNLENKEGVLNLGTTAEGYRNQKYELADNTEKKAVSWDLKSDHIGWMSGEGDVIDTVDFIKFKSKESGALEITGNFGDKDVITFNGETINKNEKGKFIIEFSAKVNNILMLERNEENSMNYSISLLA